MIPYPIDASVRVSPQLSALIEARANDPDQESPVTLADMRDYIAALEPESLLESEPLHRFGGDEDYLEELDALIDEYGEDATAIEFARAYASEALTRLIDAAINDDNRGAPPTLGNLREAVNAGLSNRLIGEGVLDEDEDDTLLEELDLLIARHGADAPAEEFMRYE